MNEVLTLEEMKSRYAGEWVLVEDPELDENLDVIRGKILGHDVDRDVIYRLSRDLNPTHAAYLYAGQMSDGTVLVL